VEKVTKIIVTQIERRLVLPRSIIKSWSKIWLLERQERMLPLWSEKLSSPT
jgi:hypothetical protein